jgi:hypothetical protein
MKRKLTALFCALAGLSGLAAVAVAAPIPVALYTFQTQGDIDAFSKGLGAKCKRAWSENKQMAINVGAATNSCVYRSSVIGDSTVGGADTEVTANATLAASTPRALQKKGYVGVGTRVSESAGWELRVRPVAKSWQLFRDPKGTAKGLELYRSGKGKFIRGLGKPNLLLLRSFNFGGASTQIVAAINGRTLVSATDPGGDQPDGRRSVVSAGVKGAAAGTGVTGIFDDVAIKVPNPF